ncbi:MAG: translesion DNA synthesis-associated protein ImuA [Gammaproteobacteria bacterium]
MNFEELIRRAGVWRAGELSPQAVRRSGYAGLDAILPGGGWPCSGLTEILSPAVTRGALHAVLPALAALSREERWIVWVNPPHAPYAPALHAHGVDLARVMVVELPEAAATRDREALWACEQALRFEGCGAALAWLDEVPMLALRRLQLAAETGLTWGVLFRPSARARQASPAPLRLALEACPLAADAGPPPLELTVLKAHGGRNGARCRIVPTEAACDA